MFQCVVWVVSSRFLIGCCIHNIITVADFLHDAVDDLSLTKCDRFVIQYIIRLQIPVMQCVCVCCVCRGGGPYIVVRVENSHNNDIVLCFVNSYPSIDIIPSIWRATYTKGIGLIVAADGKYQP